LETENPQPGKNKMVGNGSEATGTWKKKETGFFCSSLVF